MIRIKNLNEYVVELQISGTQTTNSAPTARCSAIVPFAGRISAVIGRLGVAGVTGAQATDLQVNGVSIMASGTLLSYATTSVVPTYASTLTANPTLVAKGDVLTLINSTIHSGTAAIDQCVYVTIEKQKSGSFADVLQTDTVDVVG